MGAKVRRQLLHSCQGKLGLLQRGQSIGVNLGINDSHSKQISLPNSPQLIQTLGQIKSQISIILTENFLL